MGPAPARLPLASIVAMSIVLCCYILVHHGANSEEVFPEADGPAAENSDELWLRSGPPPRVVDVDDYATGDAGGDDDTEVNLLADLVGCCSLDCSVTQSSCGAGGQFVPAAVLIDVDAARVSGVSRGVERGLQLLR